MEIEFKEFLNVSHLYFNMKHLFSRLSYSTRNCHNLYLLTHKVCCVWYSNTQSSVCDASVPASFRHRANGVKSLRTRGRTVLNKRIHNMNFMISLYYSNVFKHIFDIHVFVCISYSYQRKLVCVWKKYRKIYFEKNNKIPKRTCHFTHVPFFLQLIMRRVSAQEPDVETA